MLLAGSLLLPAAAETITSDNGTTLEATTIASFDEPWAMTFLPCAHPRRH
jgi:hypothetical protein